MLGVYIHIPFCNNICSYCDFCKVLSKTNYIDKYLECLEQEIKKRYNGEIIRSIYIGGGTPSSLNINNLNKLFEIIKIFKLKKDYEYTIECNVSDINKEKLILFKKYGINRISIGVESFDNDVRQILGRIGNMNMIFDKVLLVKQYFDNINIDLIYGVNDNMNIVKHDMDNFLKLDIPHISCYSLILEEHTKLYIDKYKRCNDNIDYKMYKYINDILGDNGYKHYEISNYAKDGYESIHNKNYWLNGEYYGFGLGAVSYLNNYRISNTKNMTKYLVNNYSDSKVYENVNTRKENDLILGLRLVNGINVSNFNRKYNDDLLNRDIICKLINNGYLVKENENIKCNCKYLYLQNSILEEIMGSDL